ncbi:MULTISPECIES: TetR/AcrR family transcriptional regulator [unclassified Crossiella]|uniref:TetR/AcrR family transcriptional regulator n=1 Tax=unclassified Crossiella TaxID=2620835 RepID=UPI001FFFB8A6|nr:MULTISPECIES: TetR/AcrR family transcriptional regulator [unclassified Crossiella]MCK2236379.1 TetR/AcrR family transcriptional regulator [Crossiella sp. S99.2]MCK2250046.1 TetR/AcrR family transcriptional regulator [Crossiella sp. S99.1]
MAGERAADRAGRVRGRPRDPGNDTAILRAALDMFIQGGVEGTSIEQVAKRAGVARLTVYRRWASKELLLAQAIEFGRDRFMNPAEVLAVFADGEVTRAKLVEILVQAVADPDFRQLVGRLASTSTSHPELMRAYTETYVQPRKEVALQVFRLLQEHGELPPDIDLEMLMESLAGVVTYVMLMHPARRGPEEVRAYLNRFLDLVISPARTSNPG